MIVFIDESGDSGMKFGQGSSPYFICVAAIFESDFGAGACDREIDALRRRLKLDIRFEFHFSQTSDKLRREFLRVVATQDFCYHGFVLNKAKLFGDRFHSRQGFYDFTVGLLCENARELFRDAKVVIDRTGDRRFLQQLTKSLKDRMIDADGTCLIKKVGMEASHSNNLVQLADMLCGAVARSFNTGKLGAGDFRRIVARREARVQFWPK